MVKVYDDGCGGDVHAINVRACEVNCEVLCDDNCVEDFTEGSIFTIALKSDVETQFATTTGGCLAPSVAWSLSPELGLHHIPGIEP